MHDCSCVVPEVMLKSRAATTFLPLDTAGLTVSRAVRDSRQEADKNQLSAKKCYISLRYCDYISKSMETKPFTTSRMSNRETSMPKTFFPSLP